MPFIKAKNGNVIELAADLVEEFLAQGHAGPFDTAEEALGRATKPRRGPKRTKETAESKAPAAPEAVEEPKELEDADEADELDESEDADELEQEPAAAEDADESEPSVERPSRGASQAAWAAYADAVGVAYPAGSGRDEIRDLVEAVEDQGADS